MRSIYLWLAGAVLAAAAAAGAGCGSSETPRFSGFDEIDAAPAEGGEAGRPVWDAIEVDPAQASLTVTLGAPAPQQAYKVRGVRGGQKSDITGDCGLTVEVPELGGIVGMSFVAKDRGGVTKIVANCNGQVGSGNLTIKLAASLVEPGAPANAAALFQAAQTATNPSRTPAIEYPIDQAVAPQNIPPLNPQWTTAGNDLFRLTLASTNMAIEVFTTSADAMPSATVWSSITGTAMGDTIKFRVEGLLQSAPTQKFESPEVGLKLSRDRVDQTAIYYWASNKGDLMTQTFGETTAPSSVRGSCTSCHALSRSGRRVGYSRCVGGTCADLFAGFLKYDPQQRIWVDTVNADTKTIKGSYFTFSPVGNPFTDDTKSLAIISMATGNLDLYDPDTGQVVPSNLPQVSVQGATQPRSGLMADWSPDGKSVAFVTAPAQSLWIDVDNAQLATLSYSFNGGQHVFGAPQVIVGSALTLPSGTYDNFFFPSWSPDGKLLVFNAARAAWRNFTDARSPGQRLALTDGAGAFVVELAAMNGSADLNVTWPHWAPANSSEYYWVVFSSERDYGHKLTAANSPLACKGNGVLQCKQIWIGAISKSKIPQPGATNPPDPSSPPVWMPGQDADANNISPYWTLPTSSIPR